MAQDPEIANPFAIPDFWKKSPWLDTGVGDGNSLFSFDISRWYFAPGCHDGWANAVQSSPASSLQVLTAKSRPSPSVTTLDSSVFPLFSKL